MTGRKIRKINLLTGTFWKWGILLPLRPKKEQSFNPQYNVKQGLRKSCTGNRTGSRYLL